MKIAIMTLPMSSNYGGILQCYALQTVLTRMGHSVVVLNAQYPTTPGWRNNLRLLKRCYLYYVKKDKASYPFPWYTPKRWNGIIQNLRIFVSRHIHMTEPVCTTAEFRKAILSHGIEGVVYGSDQIWRPCYSPGLENFFGQFIFPEDHIRQVAYAASFGTDQCEFTQEQLQKCGPLLRRFDAVSVREVSGIELCHTCFGVEACQMIDPTLLLQPDDYVQLIDQAEMNPIKGDLLIFVLDRSPEKDAIVAAVTKSWQLYPYDIGPKFGDSTRSFEERIQMPVAQWLRGFQEAKMVVTDSFHGCVFSILFQKPFVAIGNASRGMARFTSLLRTFGLEERLICSLEEFQSRKSRLMMPIDYGVVNSRLQDLREKSMTFLRQHLT